MISLCASRKLADGAGRRRPGSPFRRGALGGDCHSTLVATILPGVGLGDVMTSAAAAVGVPDCHDALALEKLTARWCASSSLGATAIEDHREIFPSLLDA